MKPVFLLLNFEITSFCNAKCPSCFRTSEFLPEKISFKHLSIEDFEDFIFNNISFFKKHGYENLVAKFCGEIGDPMMHPQLERLIYLASTVFDRIEIFTNGGLRNPKWIKNILKKYEKVYFVFGIDGLTDDINQKYRIGVRTDLALSNMIESSKHRYTKWDFTIFEHNYHQLQDVIDFAKKYKIYMLARINGRPYSKLDSKKIPLIENILKKSNVEEYFLCRKMK